MMLLAAGFLLILGLYQYSRPLPAIDAISSLSVPETGKAITLPWPAYGQAAISAQGYGLLATSGEQKPVPMASIAKVVTALAVLKQKPLEKGQQGPNITISKDDVAIYNSYYSQDGSVVKVEAGEQISQYQALQALLIPSANNMAETLARWAFGSMENYVTYANQMLQGLSLQNTQVADASGFSPQSVSSAKDLARLGLAAIGNAVLASIVGQQTAELPVAGTVNNLNWLLGEDGVIGIKTGNTDQAGGCYLFASRRVVDGQSVTVVGAVMGAPDRNTAISDSRTILRSIDTSFENVVVIHKDQIIGYYQTPWGAKADAVADQNLSILAWRGSQLQTNAKLNKLKAPARAGTLVGSVSVTSGQKTSSIPVILKSNLPGPSWHWRILR